MADDRAPALRRSQIAHTGAKAHPPHRGVAHRLEAERDAALERLNQIADEPFDTPEEEAELSRRMELADQEYGRIEEKIAEAEHDFRHAQEDFDDLLSGADDDEGSDGDTGETLGVHDAADIWLSKGMGEDYRFGYTEDELQRAAEEK